MQRRSRRAVIAAVAVVAATLAIVGATAASAQTVGDGDVVIDQVGGRVFATGETGVRVYDLAGRQTGTVAIPGHVTDLALRGRKLYAAVLARYRIYEVDADTKAVLRSWATSSSDGTLPASLAFAGDKLFYSTGEMGFGGFGFVDLAANTVTDYPLLDYYGGGRLAGFTNDRLYVLVGGNGYALDTSVSPPTQVAQTGFAGQYTCSYLEEIVLTADASKVLAACSGTGGLLAFDAATLAPPTLPYPVKNGPYAVDRSADGRRVVTTSDFGAPVVQVFDTGQPEPIQTFALGASGLARGALAVSADGNLVYALTTDGVLHTFDVRVVSDGVWDYHNLQVTGTYTPLVGQFGGDSATDILWYAAGSTPDALWIGHQGQRGSAAFTKQPLAITGTYQPVVGDFAGDEYSDIYWYGSGATADPLWVSTRGAGDVARFDTTRRDPVGGVYASVRVLRDFHAGAKDDLFFYAPGSTPDYLHDFAADGSGRITSKARPVGGSFRLFTGDWDGNLREDLFFYGRLDAPDYRWSSGAGTTYRQTIESVGGDYTPVTLYDDRDNILWWTSGPGPDYYWASTPTSFQSRAAPTISAVGKAYSGGRNQAVIVGPGGNGLTFDGSRPESWFEATGGGRIVPGTGTVPLVGDFDADGYSDYLWYGSGSLRDDLWYADTSSLQASGRVAPPAAPKVTPIGER